MSCFCPQTLFFSSPDTIVASSSIGFSKARQTLYGIRYPPALPPAFSCAGSLLPLNSASYSCVSDFSLCVTILLPLSLSAYRKNQYSRKTSQFLQKIPPEALPQGVCQYSGAKSPASSPQKSDAPRAGGWPGSTKTVRRPCVRELLPSSSYANLQRRPFVRHRSSPWHSSLHRVSRYGSQ